MTLLLGSLVMALTTMVHGTCTLVTLRLLLAVHAERWGPRSARTQVSLVTLVVLMLFVASLIEAAIWASCYVEVGALSDWDDALYFSIVTYTTLGYGDFTLSRDWRLLGTVEAVNGILLFGWSTALVVAVVQHLRDARRQPGHH